MIKSVYILFLCFIMLGCNDVKDTDSPEMPSESESPRINYGNNIIVLVDLSNRVLKPKSVHDTTILNVIIDNLKPLIEKSLNYNIKDKFKVYSINQYVVDRAKSEGLDIDLDIDLARFEGNQLDISNYLYNRVEDNYTKEVNRVKKSISRIYENNQSNEIHGADLWNFLNFELTNNVIDTTILANPFNGKTYLNKRKNKVILLTDGYIEAGRYGDDPSMSAKKNPNMKRYLSGSLMNEIRSDFHHSEDERLKQFIQNNNYGIIPIENPLLSNVELLILEVDDRTLKNGITTVTPSDGEIIQLLWQDWLVKSGVKAANLTIHKTFKNKNEVKQVINKFLNSKN